MPLCTNFNNIAVSYQGKDYTFNDLSAIAAKVAEVISGSTQKGDKVVVQLPKSHLYVAVLMGIASAGRVFVPVADNVPFARVREIVEDCKATYVVDERNVADITFAWQDGEHQHLGSEAPLNDWGYTRPYLAVTPNRPLYCIYTSGSTGKPKGVEVYRRGVGNLVVHQSKAFEADEDSRFLWLLSNSFDGHLSDLFVANYVGATLVIPDESPTEVYSRFFETIEKYRISHVDAPPALLKLLVGKEVPACLKTIVVGGEALDAAAARYFADRVRLVSVYGPTEATICTSLCVVDKDWTRPLIGKPFENVFYKVVNGELWIGANEKEPDEFRGTLGKPPTYEEMMALRPASQLAAGYVNNPALTAARFVEAEGKRWYLTGDAVKETEEGDYEFLGRIDRQMKYHGQLVAPEEVEAVYGKKADTCLRLLRDRLVLFVEAESEELFNEVVSTPVDVLAPYMVPAQFVRVYPFPRTASGKVDEKQLVLPRQETADAVYADETERKIAELFAEVTELDYLPSPYTSFLDIGSSLGAVALICRLSECLGFSVNPDDFLRNPTPRGLANLCKKPSGVSSRDILESVRPMFVKDKLDKNPCLLRKNVVDVDLDHATVLVTGANGFLGRRVLVDFLNRHPEAVAYALVRNARTLFDLPDDLKVRVFPLVGDITDPLLGIRTRKTYDDISKIVDLVVHCAGEVNMLKSYEELKGANVVGTANVISFCHSGKKKPLHFASTLSVFVSTSKNVGVLKEDDDLSDEVTVHGGYGASKFAAELLVQHSGLPVAIYRYGLLTADTRDGSKAPKDFLTLFAKGAEKSGVLPLDPDGELAVDITPVDYAAARTVDVIESGATGSFHVSSQFSLLYNRGIVEGLVHEGRVKVYAKSNAEWFNDPSVDTSCKLALSRLSGGKLPLSMDLFQATNAVFDRKQLEQVCSAKTAISNEYLASLGFPQA